MTAQHAATPSFRHRAESEWIMPFPGEQIAIHIDGEQTDRQFSLGEAIIDPNVGPPLHIHHNLDELLYVLEGEMDFVLEDRRFRTGPGGFVYIPKGSRHSFRNFGTTPARMLGFMTPSGMDGFFEAMQRRPASDLPDIAQAFGLEIVGPQIEPQSDR